MANTKSERLDKCVSHLTGMSRKQAAKAIKDGEVTVNGEIIFTPDIKIAADALIVIEGFNDDLSYESEGEITIAADAFKKRVFLLNKPYDFVCADRDKNHRVVLSLFADELKAETLHCAGRLDIDTTGVLAVTDDGDLIHEITSPKKSVTKLYYAVLDKEVPDNAVNLFARGIKHPEEKKRYLPAKLTVLPDSADGRHRACVELTEGRYHEVKRLFECVGCTVTHLSRLAGGSLILEEELMIPGSYRLLKDEEVALLSETREFTKEEMIQLAERCEEGLRLSPAHLTPPAYRQNTDSENTDAYEAEEPDLWEDDASYSQF